jgi:flagellar biosynthetic protein FliR
LAKIGLSFFAAIAVYPVVAAGGYPLPDTGFGYAALVAGEVLVGIIMGFFLNLIYSSFLVAGQFFSLQMGFGASQVYDPLAQIQIPLMGQFLNTIGMFVFIAVGGFQKVFLHGLLQSFLSVKAVDFAAEREYIFGMVLRGLGSLFEHSLVIAFPILGTLFLVSLTMGLLAKAAPQMNLLMMGFPVAIFVAFGILMLIMPYLVETFASIINGGFNSILILLDRAQRGAG